MTPTSMAQPFLGKLVRRVGRAIRKIVRRR
jgi:hypothetical protein